MTDELVKIMLSGNDTLHRIINNHIKDEARARIKGDFELAEHIKSWFDKYVNVAQKRQGRFSAFNYECSREQYLDSVIGCPKSIDGYGFLWWR